VAKVSVFFIDDNQIVRPGEITIVCQRICKIKNVQVIEFELSHNLDATVQMVLSIGLITIAIKNTANVIWNEGDESTFRL
jgi:hypothetical protein